jgi:hypothetical protein
MARNAKDAIAWGRAQITDRSRDWTGWCLVFVRSCFGVGAVFPSAIAAWDNAKKKHHDPSSKVPRGVPIFWRGGKHGHVALSLGISTDARRRGWPDVVTIDSISQSWGYEFLGWTEDINGVAVYTPPAKRTPNITQALSARTVAKRIEALQKVEENGNKTAAKAARTWIDALNERSALDKKIASARTTLQKQERV